MNNIIKIELNNKEDYKNKFNNKRISEQLDKYITNEIKSTNLKDKIILEIETKVKLTKEEKDELIKMIKLSYKDDLDELIIYEKKMNQKSLILLSGGIMILLGYYLFINIFFLSEFILIIGWLLIWESADIFLFSKMENKIKQTRSKQLIHSNIIFR